jgi:hypothetical protein
MSAIERYRSPEADDRAFAMLERKVNALSRSNLLPTAVRGKPADALLVALKGYELGLTFVASFAHLFVVNGTVGQSAQLLADEAHKAGYDVWTDDGSNAEWATAYVRNRRNGQVHSLTWTIEEAQRAKLTEKTNWQLYPSAMLRARAISNAVRAFCRGIVLAPGVVLETPDELGADVVEFEEPEREQLTRPAVDVPSAPAPAESAGGSDGEEGTPPSLLDEAPAGEPEPEKPNPYAKGVHIEASRAGLSDEALDEILYDVCGEVSAGAVTRENAEEVVRRIRAAKEPAA